MTVTLTTDQVGALLRELEYHMMSRYDMKPERLVTLLAEDRPIFDLYAAASRGPSKNGQIEADHAVLRKAIDVIRPGVLETLTHEEAQLAAMRSVIAAAPNPIRRVIDLHGVEIDGVAKEIGVHGSVAQAWYDGEITPTDHELARIAHYYGESLAFVRGESDESASEEEEVRWLDIDTRRLRILDSIVGGQEKP